MAQAVSRRPLAAENWVKMHASPRGIYGGQSGRFSPRTLVFPSQHDSNNAP
jgi:hypothetical protein